MARPIRVAACHVSAVFLSAKGTTEKAISLIHQAAKNRANLVVFPETFIPAFPIWSSIRPPTENHGLFQKMAQQSIYIDGPEMSAIQAAAKKSTTIVSIGVSEYRRRKLMPTFFEKLTWSPGDGYGLRVAETPFGKIGNLICGENTNPLARYSLMALGEELHISTWPAIWPTRAPLPVETEGFKEVEPTSASSNDEVGKKGPVDYDNVAANRMRAAAHCFEAKCFGVLCSGRFDEMAIDLISEGSSNAQHIRRTLEQSPAAATMFLGPTGALLPGYTIDAQSGKKLTKDFLQKEEDILYADMDLNDCIEGKQYHDVVGGYQRLDVFDLKVNRSRRVPASFVDDFTPN
ncbi:related to aliphatic nitrilase [Rhynchosporium graminicola]|uniref:Related to aliphatic nitrilase n=1 Tax=Rhynchosporium graminicola TaxID=2792576 RepID=A0A1E1JXH8_9HELO|nr:related to aliphatic nitrilase [Rhynchosporium commune]